MVKSFTLMLIALFTIALSVGCGGSGGGSTANLGDTTAPSSPANLVATVVSSSQIDLSWNSSTDNVGVTGYRVYRDGSQIATTSATTYSDTGLTAETTYGYKVLAYDSATNISPFSNVVSATTQAASTGGTGGTGGNGGGNTGGGSTADTEAPSVPSGLTGTAISSSEIELSWSASTDNVAVTGYKIYRNNALLTSVTGTAYSDTGLTSSTTYSYKIAAYDAVGNTSAQSSSANATTQEQTITSNIATLPFTDDFSGDLSKWALWGDPLSEIDSAFGNTAPSVNPNGDGNYDSGIVSNDVFDFSNGIVMEADLIHPVTESLWTWVGFGLSATSTIDSWGGYDIGVGVHIEPPNVSYVVTGDSGFSRPSDTNWHSYKVVIRSDLKVEFYRDNILEYTSTNALTLSGNMPFVIAGRDVYGNVRADNVRISPDETLFNEDFSSDLSKWISWGSPLPEIDSANGNILPSINPNGDGNYDSGVRTIDTYDFSKGLVIESDLIHPVTESLWTWVGFGLAKTDSEESWGGYDIGVGVHIEPPNISYVSIGDSGFTKPSDTNWHSYKIVIRPDLKVEFYSDDVLEYTTTNTLTLTTDKPFMIAGRDYYGAVRADNTKISPYTYIFSENFSTDLSKWTLWGDPLPEIDSTSGNSLPSFNPNGDGMYDSGAITPTPYDFSSGGCSISADMLVPAGWSEGWTFTGLAITTDNPTNYGTSSGMADTGCLAYIQLNDNNKPYSMYRVPGITPSEGSTWEDPLENAWHTFTIRIRTDRKIEFYKDDILKATTTGALTISQLSQAYIVVAGRDAFSDVRIDNVKITK